MPDHPLPYSFNEIYLAELGLLRPAAFGGNAPRLIVPVPFESGAQSDTVVTADEQERAANLRDIYAATHDRLDVEGDAARKPLSALCLSGGGIRSATFNLGVLQRLAGLRVLGCFDYLSTVSGGGYIGGWLHGWMYRAGRKNAPSQLAVPPVGGFPPTRDPLAPETLPIDRLREYSNYLTPKVGLFSPDSWTAGALIVRNLMLNWLVIVPFLAACVAIPQLALLLMQSSASHRMQGGIVGAAVLLAFIASTAVHLLRHPNQTRGRPGQRTIILTAVLPLYGAAVLLSLGASWAPWQWWGTADRGYFVSGPLARAIWRSGAAQFVSVWTVWIPLLGWLVAEGYRRLKRERAAEVSRGRSPRWELVAIVLSGAVAGLLLWWVTDYALCGAECESRFRLIHRPGVLTVLALPVLLGDYLLARALFVAIASAGEEVSLKHGGDVSWNDYDREWWGRLSGWVLALAVGWLVVSIVTLLGGFLVQRYALAYARQAVAAMGGIAGVLTAVLAKSAGTSAGRGTQTISTSSGSALALKFAAPLFVVALLVLLADANAALGRKVTGDPSLLRVEASSVGVLRAPDTPAHAGAAEHVEGCGTAGSGMVCQATVTMFVRIIVLMLAITLVASWVVDINRFSLHGFYRNRLVRAFLGASNTGRQPDPFTGFSLTDNVRLAELVSGDADLPAEGARLLPLINTTLNLVAGGHRLAWQLRKAESFSMTPLFCGNFHEGYRPSREYGGRGGITLGTAITISGAAANPNMGYNSSPSVTFLMTLLNSRLGAWLGNTNENGGGRLRTYRHAGPRMALWPILAELLGLTNAARGYVNLSDGGHFDNLGLYEVVLRRCHYVLVCDAGRDPSAAFDDLGNAIRKVRIDFGIPIEFRQRIHIEPRGQDAQNLFCATADIMYSAVDGTAARNGRLVYVKPALYGHGTPIPYDVIAYANNSGDFPHESTTDQWFDEAQFESYRALGLHTIGQIAVARSPFDGCAPFFDAVDAYIKEASGGTAAAPPPSHT